MRITGIGKKNRLQAEVLFLLLVFLVFGCTPKSDLGQAKRYARRSGSDYASAVRIYQDLIAKGKGDIDKLHFDLGQLYFKQGEFKDAIREFKKTAEPLAKKFIAIAYYRDGDFTDALEVFNKNEIADEEYLYYQGLTSEKLNLFDKALEAYRKIKGPEFSSLAGGRINIIEKQVALRDIKDVDPVVARIVSDAPEAKNYPQAGALVLSCVEKSEVTPGNSEISTFHYIVKILNERGKEDFSEAKIDYDSTYEKIELVYARTIRPDGKVVEVGARHIRDVSKYLNFPLYSNARVYIISFPEIAKGSVIEYEVKIYRSQLINKKDFAIGYPVQASEPVISADFTLSVPAERKIKLKELNKEYDNFTAELKPQIKKEADNLVYAWRFLNLPQVIPEPNMPPDIEINPTVLISSFESWEDIYRWWWKLAEDKIKADTAIKDKVKELTQGLSLAQEKARAVYNFCAKEIRYVAVEYGDAGYEPHKAEDIFRNKYGDCKDQAILLVTMLKEAGFSAWPVLIPTRDCYNLDPEFPSMLFNHAIAAVELEGKIVFLDPTAETCPLGDLPQADQGRRVLLIKADRYGIEETPFYPAEHNLNKQSLKIKVNADESISAAKEILTYGVYGQAQRHWLLHTTPELIEDALKEKIQGISIGAELQKYAIKNLNDLNMPVELNYTFSGPEYFTSAGTLRIMPQLAHLDTSLVANDRRKYPLDFVTLDSEETALEISIPADFRLKFTPQNITEDNTWFKFSAQYSWKGNTLYFRQEMQAKKSMVPESRYPEFKKIFESLAKKVKQRIILEKKNNG